MVRWNVRFQVRARSFGLGVFVFLVLFGVTPVARKAQNMMTLGLVRDVACFRVLRYVAVLEQRWALWTETFLFKSAGSCSATTPLRPPEVLLTGRYLVRSPVPVVVTADASRATAQTRRHSHGRKMVGEGGGGGEDTTDGKAVLGGQNPLHFLVLTAEG